MELDVFILVFEYDAKDQDNARHYGRETEGGKVNTLVLRLTTIESTI